MTFDRNPVFVLLPVYNEGEAIYRLLFRLAAALEELGPDRYEIVTIDDGSSDDSRDWIARAVAELPDCFITCLEHERNAGLAAALRTGLAHVRAGPEDATVVTMDGDDTHDPSHIGAMLQKMAEGADMVIASRYRRGAKITGLSVWRRLLSYVAAVLYSLRWRIPGVRDYTCNYRSYRLSLLRRAEQSYGDHLITEDGFAAVTELLYKVTREANSIAEVPMVLNYERKFAASHNPIGKTIARSLRLLASDVGKS
tara:strand:- start:1017 stop:1778 length:762 start_codon:yes stop_codon:yes gene_type:complete